VIRGNIIGILVLAGLLSMPLAAQQPKAQGAPQQPQQHNNHKGQGQKSQPGIGDWLRAHKDMPLDQQEKLLESDPMYKKLSPERQTELKERLRKFNGLPPEQRERALKRMEFMQSLSPEQRKQLREANQQLQNLPQERRVAVHKALRHLHQMSPQERQQTLQSDTFRSTFSEQEQNILKQLAAIEPVEGPAPESK